MPLSDFQVVIGLEVHAQLLTRSKIFCGCSTAFGGAPNAHTCPVCLGLPGALPALNRAVVEMAVRTGLALGCEIRPKSVFARKNYFYPDLPKGYQISQYELPICEGGEVTFTLEGRDHTARLVRIHMEEDAGKNVHDVSADGASGVDLNRAGVPLVEIVSRPDLRSAEEAVEYLKALRAILMALGVNDGNMQEGSLRCDANVSVMRKGASELGTRCEIKNMNSFRFLKQAIEFEARRQVELIEAGEPVVQETRLFDPDRGETRSMRSKEEAHDYRYFPEPDLPPVIVEAALVERIRGELPELPRARAERYQRRLGLSAYDAGNLVADAAVAAWFDAALGAYGAGPEAAKKVANWVTGELARLANETGEAPAAWKMTPARLAAVLRLVDAGTIGGPGAKQVVEEVFRTGAEPDAVVKAKGLAQVSDEGAIEAAVDKVLAANPGEAEKYRGGRKNLLGFFVGQVMKEMRGKGNPAVVNALLRRKLGD
ncbi:glutamyl-tRNA(Gln) amidotransferase, B subunit [Anaeromyxobacter dehalogenans 2CP-1]|uniref:Aspartyl/glutamyl-tRNA(Asn/Gln) amidotransferase subunit B n=1 Tax=Anaeromyxobacter dehalogenans (strain ATCC BAA-258 / DSM 21875 / 2CP-1) TaxID=455488 RepID=GATB_ANAD2|nr:Asp-tRNA(Asn)/Glu-tRNA(Gln) amidotransferase subunit GatB [Anaeromyxobacter dehalogenans]B8JBQ0.1 RecName: Full=Aspartyl/glutamyl-tRNA(Asn/Gln) amidotransferase subunit B; Short=Asp/Glu-ADT subunit B [Anaeromyxobacter dehalogenans 2CP-1]ACL67658.1 glutamyl-tRNA(Gln) amidotransferase, B subunit [Anaeromyxobacter dehalogenans 2CP-1]